MSLASICIAAFRRYMKFPPTLSRVMEPLITTCTEHPYRRNQSTKSCIYITTGLSVVVKKSVLLLKRKSNGIQKTPTPVLMLFRIPLKNWRNTILMTSTSIRTRRKRVKTMMMRRRILQESAATMMTQTFIRTI